MFANLPTTYREAKRFCASKGGHLAEIDSQEEYDAVEDHWRTLDKTACDEQIKSWWLGLTDAAKEGSWVADISGDKPTFTKWNESKNNYCFKYELITISLQMSPITMAERCQGRTVLVLIYGKTT